MVFRRMKVNSVEVDLISVHGAELK